jgi:hypothetical protein
MELNIEPDVGIPMPATDAGIYDFKERAAAACATAEHLGLDTTPTEEDLAVAEVLAYALAEDEPKAQKQIAKKASNIQPATYVAVNSILKDFAIKVVDNAQQIRLVVTNKLLLETSNPDPRVRIRALELLGKITDVGLFTERSEVTITHRSKEELVLSLREKIQRLRASQDVIDVNISETLGLPEEIEDVRPS